LVLGIDAGNHLRGAASRQRRTPPGVQTGQERARQRNEFENAHDSGLRCRRGSRGAAAGAGGGGDDHVETLCSSNFFPYFRTTSIALGPFLPYHLYNLWVNLIQSG